MAKAKMYGIPRRGIPNNRCFDKRWKNKNERNTKYDARKQNKYPANGPGCDSGKG